MTTDLGCIILIQCAQFFIKSKHQDLYGTIKVPLSLYTMSLTLSILSLFSTCVSQERLLHFLRVKKEWDVDWNSIIMKGFSSNA